MKESFKRASTDCKRDMGIRWMRKTSGDLIGLAGTEDGDC